MCTRTAGLINSKVSGCTGRCYYITSICRTTKSSATKKESKWLFSTVTCKCRTAKSSATSTNDKEGGLLINSKVSDCYQLVNVTAVTCKYTGRQCYQYDKESSSTQWGFSACNVTAVTCKYTHLQDGKVKCYQYDKEGGLLINSKVSQLVMLLLLHVSKYTHLQDGKVKCYQEGGQLRDCYQGL